MSVEWAFALGFSWSNWVSRGGATLAQALTEVVDQAKGDVVLIVDEVQQAITTEEGNQMLLALKAARDAINPRPGTPGHFLFLGTGSHRALVGELTARRNQALAGANSLPYPVLDLEYVRHVLQRLRAEDVKPLPSEAIAWEAFQTLGHRPEEFLRALGQLQASSSSSGLEPDQLLPVIAATLRGTAADLELQKVEHIGGLAIAIFDRVAREEGPAKGLFSAEAAAAYGEAIGREVRVEEIQPVVNELLADNVLMRLGHGLYGVADPFVQEIWRERQNSVTGNQITLQPGTACRSHQAWAEQQEQITAQALIPSRRMAWRRAGFIRSRSRTRSTGRCSSSSSSCLLVHGGEGIELQPSVHIALGCGFVAGCGAVAAGSSEEVQADALQLVALTPFTLALRQQRQHLSGAENRQSG